MQSRSVRNLNGVHQAEDLDHLVEVDLAGVVLVIHSEGPSDERLTIKKDLQMISDGDHGDSSALVTSSS